MSNWKKKKRKHHLPMAHCNIPSSEENPPSRSALSLTPTVDSWASDFLIRSPSSFAVDQNSPPEDDLLTRSAWAITAPTNAKSNSQRARPDALRPITFWRTKAKAVTLLPIYWLFDWKCLYGRCLIDPGNYQVTALGPGKLIPSIYCRWCWCRSLIKWLRNAFLIFLGNPAEI